MKTSCFNCKEINPELATICHNCGAMLGEAPIEVKAALGGGGGMGEGR
jgi:hypothetical protein